MNWADTRINATIGLDIHRPRNTELLRGLFGDREIFEFSGAVPAKTDLCIIDEAALERSHERFSTWQTAQSPVFAPVILLSESSTSNPWDAFESTLMTPVDSIIQIPVSKIEFRTRVDKLLEMRKLSRELVEEKQLSELIFETSPLAKFVFDADHRIVRANSHAVELTGIAHEDLIGEVYNMADWTVTDEAGVVISEPDLPVNQVFQTGEPIYDHVHLLSYGGEELWVSANIAPIVDEWGDVLYVIATINDITESRAQAVELERKTELLEQAEHIANVGAWEFDVLAEEFWTSHEVNRIFGQVDDGHPFGIDRSDRYHPDDRQSFQTAWARAIDHGESFDNDLRIVRDEGEQRWVKVRGEVTVEDGQPVRIRGFIQDITAQKERELELDQLRNAVKRSPLGIILTDPNQDDNPIIYANEGFESMTDYTAEDVIGRNCRFLQGASTNPQTVAKIRRAISAQRPVSVVIRNYRADGSMFWNHLDIAPIRDAEGELMNFIGFQQDVTEREENRKQLDVIDRYLRHNLRNRLNVVEGMADLIRTESEPPLTEYAEMIMNASDSLLDTMDKEREVAQILQRDIDLTPIDLMVGVRDRIEQLRTEYPDADISVSGPDTVMATAIPELPVAIEEVVRNAIEHAQKPSPTVSIAVSEHDGYVEIQIVDDGPGMPDLEIDVLSTPELESAVYHGQGLGLWMVTLIVRRSRGEILFEDRSPTGTVVTITVAAGTK